MGKKIVLIGGGGHCKSVLDTLLRNREYEEIVITDPGIPAGERIMGCAVAGNDDVLPALLKAGFCDAFVTVGSISSTKLRRILFEKAAQIGFRLVNITDCSAVVADSAQLGKGVFIGKAAVVNAEARIGNAAIINTGAIVEHECRIGNFVHVSVGAALCGNVSVGDDTLIGAGAVVIQDIRIGERVIIGAGSTVIGDVGPDVTRVGIVKAE